MKGDRLFIADSNHNRIVISSLGGKLIDVIGSGKIGATDGDYAKASFDHPQGMTLVGDTLYVADTENHLLRAIDLKSKTVATLAGTGVQARRRFQQGPLRELALNSPWDLQHLNGVLYVAMAGPHQLWKHELGTGTIELFAGTGREDITDGPLDACALAQPSAIVTDGKAMYIVDSEGSAIRELKDGNVTTIVGPHDLPRGRSLFEFGDDDGTGDDVRLQHPIGAAYHNGMLYVADTYNDKIKLVDIKKRTAKTWLGTGERGNGLDPVQLNEPAGLVVAGDSLFIADTNNHRILKVNLETKATEVFNITGLAPPTSTGSDAPQELATGEAEKVAKVSVAGKQVTFKVNFELTDGYKLNKLAPVAYSLKAVGGQNLVDPALLNKRKKAESDDVSASVTIPLNGQSGEATIEFSVAYQYCRDGVGGVCRFATKKWQIPLNIVSAGGSQVVELKAAP